jgi:hypothetical protein
LGAYQREIHLRFSVPVDGSSSKHALLHKRDKYSWIQREGEGRQTCCCAAFFFDFVSLRNDLCFGILGSKLVVSADSCTYMPVCCVENKIIIKKTSLTFCIFLRISPTEDDYIAGKLLYRSRRRSRGVRGEWRVYAKYRQPWLRTKIDCCIGARRICYYQSYVCSMVYREVRNVPLIDVGA